MSVKVTWMFTTEISNMGVTSDDMGVYLHFDMGVKCTDTHVKTHMDVKCTDTHVRTQHSLHV